MGTPHNPNHIEETLKSYAHGHFRSLVEVTRHLADIPGFPNRTPAGSVRTRFVIDMLRKRWDKRAIEAKGRQTSLARRSKP